MTTILSTLSKYGAPIKIIKANTNDGFNLVLGETIATLSEQNHRDLLAAHQLALGEMMPPLPKVIELARAHGARIVQLPDNRGMWRILNHSNTPLRFAYFVTEHNAAEAYCLHHSL